MCPLYNLNSFMKVYDVLAVTLLNHHLYGQVHMKVDASTNSHGLKQGCFDSGSMNANILSVKPAKLKF